MNIDVRPVCALIALLGAATLIGCEDSAAKQRDAVQESLSKINMELQVAMASAGATDEDTAVGAAKLNQVISKLQQVDGGEPWQQASKAMLGAMASRELADIHIAEIDRIEADHRDTRFVVRQKLAAALRLYSIVDGLAKAEGRSERDALQRELQTAKTAVSELSDTFMKLGEPIAKQTSANDASLKEVERLRTEVSNLLRRAQELGPADGFDTYKQASQISRQADEIEFQIAQREIELDYQLTPEHKSVATQVNQLQGMIQAIEASEAHLASLAKASTDEATASRGEIDRLLKEINTALDAQNQARSGKLSTLYADALASLEKAQSQIDSAASRFTGEDAQAARLVGIRVREALGRLHWSQARALADHKLTLELLVNGSKELGAQGSYAQQLGETSVAYDQAVEKSKQHYAEAAEQLANVQSRVDPAAVASYQQHLNEVIAGLEGKVAPPPSAPEAQPEPPDESSADAASAGTDDLGPGFGSPQEAIDFIKSLAQRDESIQSLQNEALQATVTRTPQGKAIKAFVLQLSPDIESLYQAMNEKFGREATVAAFAQGGMELVPDLSAATVKQVDDSRASYTYTRGNGQQKTEWIIKVNDRWYFDGDKLDPEDQQLLVAKDMIGPIFKKAVQQTVEKVQDGSYQSANDAVQGLNQAVMAGAMQGAGQMQPQGGSPQR